jgi:hypothetical protein
MTTTFRVDVVSGMTAMITAFIAAHPTVIVRHFRSMPASTNTDLPCTWLDLRPEVIDHESGLRHRTMSPSIVAMFSLGDNQETTDLQDAAVDLLVDHFTSYPHIVAATVWDAMTVSDERLPGDTSVSLVRFTFDNISIAEGRS